MYASGKHECLCYVTLNCGPLKICPNLKLTTQLAYTVIDTDCDCGSYLNVIITFPNISMMCSIVVILIMGLYSHCYGICLKVLCPLVGKNFAS